MYNHKTFQHIFQKKIANNSADNTTYAIFEDNFYRFLIGNLREIQFSHLAL